MMGERTQKIFQQTRASENLAETAQETRIVVRRNWYDKARDGVKRSLPILELREGANVQLLVDSLNTATERVFGLDNPFFYDYTTGLKIPTNDVPF